MSGNHAWLYPWLSVLSGGNDLSSDETEECGNAQKYARTMLDNTGYEEISLSSLSSSDYENLDVLLNYLITLRDTDHVNVSLPSLRIDAFSLDVMSKVQDIKKSSLTFASEAGTQRLRDVINKGITDENLLEGSRQAFLGGWDKVKLYFMLGLPTETDEDLYGIADLAERISEVYLTMYQRKTKWPCHDQRIGIVFCTEAIYTVPVGTDDPAG